MFLFSVWDTPFTLGGQVVGYSVDWYPCFLFACQVAFGIILPCVRFEPLSVLWLCDICLLNACTVSLAWLFLNAFLIHMHVGIWFRQFCSVSLHPNEPTLNCFRWYPFLSVHTLSLFYSSLQALSLKKTMIIPTLGNFGALELFWEWVLN